MNILQEVETKLRDGSLKLNPHECAELRSKLAGEYSWLMSQLEDILMKKPHEWNSKRPELKSDTATENWWKGTALGLEEEGLRMRIKRCERLMSGLSSLIKIHDSESKNLY